MPGNAVTTDFKRIPIDEVELDLQNPRIAKWIEMYGDDVTAERLSLALGAADVGGDDVGTTFRSLKESIKTNGGIIHPVIVNQRPDGKPVVIEGNTRVLIYREFREQGVPGDWSSIPAMVYDGLGEEGTEAIRLQAHLVGPRAWDPYSKAKYLHYLRNCEHLTFSQMVDFCGGNRAEVERYIAAYEDMEKFYRPLCDNDSEFDFTRFSSFVELQQPRIQQALLEHDCDRRDFALWVKDHMLYPQNLVRSLPRILANPRSREVFLLDGAQEACKVLDVPPPDQALADASLEQIAVEIKQRILNMSYSELQRLRGDGSEGLRERLCDARDQLIQLCSDIEAEE